MEVHISIDPGLVNFAYCIALVRRYGGDGKRGGSWSPPDILDWDVIDVCPGARPQGRVAGVCATLARVFDPVLRRAAATGRRVRVWIENQPMHPMKTVQTVVQAFFELRGAEAVGLCSAQTKVRYIAGCVPFLEACPEARAPRTYAARKAATVAFARWAMARPDAGSLAAWAHRFEGARKRDDLADCLVQLLPMLGGSPPNPPVLGGSNKGRDKARKETFLRG